MFSWFNKIFVKEKPKPIWNKLDICDLCKVNPSWTEEHVSCGGSGFTFTWCEFCCKRRTKECNAIISNYIAEWRKRCKEQIKKDIK